MLTSEQRAELDAVMRKRRGNAAVRRPGRCALLWVDGKRRVDVGLYPDPPKQAAVFCVDEKTVTQAIDRKNRMLSPSPGRTESHGVEYKRNGTLSLFAALNTATGEVLGKTASCHASEQFVGLLDGLVAGQPRRRAIHVICGNVSSYTTAPVRTLLIEHPRVQIHYTPTYSPWLNQVENWFARIQREVIARGIFTPPRT